MADNRLLTNLIKCEKEHHSALLALLVRSHTSLAALSAYASTAAPPVAQALLGCIQAFATADEGLRGYAVALEGWKEELKEVKRVEDEVKTVMRDKDILVGRLIKASKQKIPTSSLQAGPAPIPNASYLAPASPSASSFSLPHPSQGYTPTPHQTQHINSKLALAQRELHACEAHLAGKEAELAEVRRSAMTEGMARRCRAMADVGHVWRERGEQGLHVLDQLGRENAGAPPPPPPHTYNPPRRSGSYSSHSNSSLSPSHSASQYLPRSQSPFGLPRSASPFHTGGQGTYQTLSGAYQHSHPLPALPERDSWHADDQSRTRPATYHQASDDRQYESERERRPMSMVMADDHRLSHSDHRRPVSSLELRTSEPVALDIPPPHSIGDHEHAEFIPLGRPVSSMGQHTGGSGSGQNSRWGDDSSSDGEDPGYNVVENQPWSEREQGSIQEDVDPEILRAVEKMGMVPPPKSRAKKQPLTPPATASPTSSPNHLPDVRVIEATPQRNGGERKRKKKKDGTLLTDRAKNARAIPPPAPIPVPGAPKLVPTPTSTAPSPQLGARPSSTVASATARRDMSPAPAPARVASPTPTPARVASPPAPSPAHVAAASPIRVASPALALSVTTTAPAPQPVHHAPSSPTHHAPSSPMHHTLSFLVNHTPSSPLLDATATLGAPSDVTMTGLSADKGPNPDVKRCQPQTVDLGSASSGPDSESELDSVHIPKLDSAHSPKLDSGHIPKPDSAQTSKLDSEHIPKPDPAHITKSALNHPEASPEVAGPQPVADDDDDELDSAFDTETLPTVAVLDTPRAKPVPVEVETPKASARTIGLETPKAAPMATLAPAATSTPRPPVAPVRVPTPVSAKPKKSSHRISSSTSEPLVRKPTHARSASKDVSEADKKPKKKKKTTTTTTKPTPVRQPSAEDRADLAAMLRNSDGPSPHVHFPAPGATTAVYVPTAPPPPRQPGAMFLPSTGGPPGAATRSDLGPARNNHFDVVPPSPVASSGHGRSVSGSTGFFGRVAGLFGRKKNSADSYGRDLGATWKTRTDGNITRARADSSSDDGHVPGNLVTVTNVNTPAGRVASVDNNPPGSAKRGFGRRLAKADRGQTLRVGPPTESPARTRSSSSTDREERFEPASPGKSKKSKAKKAGSQSVDGGGLSRKGSLKSTISEPIESGRGSSDFGGRGARKKTAVGANLMSLVEDPGSTSALAPPALSARRSDSPARSRSPQSLLSVPPARAISPSSTAAPNPIRGTSPAPLKSAMRRTPSPMPHAPPPAPIQVAAPTLVAPAPIMASPRNSIVESVYETGEEDFADESDGEDGKSDLTASGQPPAPALVPHTTSTAASSPGTALAAFKSTIAAPPSDTAASVSTAGPYSANETQPARRKSVRINPDPPEMSATPDGTPAVELDEEPRWENKTSTNGGWASRIGRGWEDSSESEDEEYERVRKALATSYKHMDVVNGAQPKGKEKSRR